MTAQSAITDTTPRRVLHLMHYSGATFAPTGDGHIRITGRITPQVRDAITQRKEELLLAWELERRLTDGLERILEPMEASGNMTTPHYATRLDQWEGRLLTAYEALLDGTVTPDEARAATRRGR